MTGVQTCALPISRAPHIRRWGDRSESRPARAPGARADARPPNTPAAVQPTVKPIIPTASAQPVVTEGVSLQFPNMEVSQVLDFYENLTGRRLIRDNAVLGTLNIVINRPVPKDEAIKIIEINLMMNNFSLVPVDGTDGKLWKVDRKSVV